MAVTTVITCPACHRKFKGRAEVLGADGCGGGRGDGDGERVIRTGVDGGGAGALFPRVRRVRSGVKRGGRDAVDGLSFRSESAFMFANPPMAMGVTVASAPPVIITSASPY